MGGIEIEAAFAATGLDPETTNFICAFAIGHQGNGSNLSEKNQEKEKPSPRMPASAFAFKGLAASPRPAE